MPKLKLTKVNIDRLPFTIGRQIEYWDTELSGFGLCVGKVSKSFIVKADAKVLSPIAGNKKFKSVKEVIGRYGVWTPEQARAEAAERIKKIKAGMPTTEASVPSLLQLAERYLNDNTRSLGTQKRYSELFKTGIFKELGQLPIDVASVIEPNIILEVFSRVSKGNGLFAAKLSFQRLQAVLN